MKSFSPKNKEEYLKVQTDRQPGYVLVGGEVPLAPWHQTLFEEFKPYLGSPHLDIGCRDGLILDKLKDEGIDAYGVEITDAAKSGIDKGRKIIQCDAQEKLPFKNKFFKSVSLLHTLEHFYKPKEAMREIKRVLDGYLLIVGPQCSEEQKDFLLKYAEYTAIPSMEEYLKFIEGCGFKIVEKYGIEIKGPHCLTIIAKT